MVFPKNRAMRLVSPDIPHELAEDFVEACAVLDVSPKASAALSRRLLQRTLHERFSINRPNLQQEILEFISTLNPPSHLAQQLDAIRSVGNFAAHPIKDTTTGAITDVEEGEAELLIETLESLFDYPFVQPAKWSATKAAINAKLSAAGKPTIGTEQEFSSSYEHMEGDTTARPIGRTEPVSIVWREPPRTSVSLSRSSKFANKSSLSMSPSPRAH